VREALEILPVRGIGRITPGADLAEAIVTAAPWLRDGDVLVVTSKIVSKAEGQLVDIPLSNPDRDAVREDVLASETARVVARRGQTRIVATHHGFVMAAAGIDASNVDPSQLVLLPKDPDGSARSLRSALFERFQVDVAVIISDTMGRPWRNGLTDVAIGAAGIAPSLDHRGEIDPYGNELLLTEMAIVDELAGAAELVKGKCDQVPVAVVRGYLPGPPTADGPGVVTLIRDSASDLFSLGTAEARALGLRDAAALGAPSPNAASSDTALSWAASSEAASSGTALSEAGSSGTALSGTALSGAGSLGSAAPGVAVRIPPLRDPLTLAASTIVEAPSDNVIRLSADPSALVALVALGVDAHRVQCALAAANLSTTLTQSSAATVLIKITP
jgi:coenzyme F420-0:L-glutamate ligase/coenzyme F420-1:gamma-L-glutamate ligase